MTLINEQIKPEMSSIEKGSSEYCPLYYLQYSVATPNSHPALEYQYRGSPGKAEPRPLTSKNPSVIWPYIH